METDFAPPPVASASSRFDSTAPDAIEQLVKLLARLPGVGQRSARRMALYLLDNRQKVMLPMADALQRTAAEVKPCHQCGNLDTTTPCRICSDVKRDRAILCVVEHVADVWAMERGRIYPGLYHVLGGTLSAIDGRGPDSLNLAKLLERVSTGQVQEVILATNATVEGQTTAHYITDRLQGSSVKISRLAQGIPLGGELDYLDEGTLGTALKLRQAF